MKYDSNEIVIVDIDYVEGNQESYKGFIIKIGDQNRRINSNEPVQDFKEMEKFIKDLGYGTYMQTSSFTHFVFDGEAYKFIFNKTNKEILVYNDK